MRTIKFRGKKVDNANEWVYGYYVVDPKGGHRIYTQPFPEATSNTYHFVVPETVCQLVSEGRIDSYEGDIVRYDTEDGVVTAVIKFVEKEESLLVCAFEYVVLEKGAHNSESVSFEIIGNIHDTPELLTNGHNECD